MSDFVFNIAKGRIIELVTADPTKLGLLLLRVAEPDGIMRKRETLADILTASIEANFTNYVRKMVTGTIDRDQTLGRTEIEIANQTWVSAGGIVDNDLLKLIVFYEESANDASRIPLTGHDFRESTNGTDMQAEVSVSGFYRAS